jgi:hypothetical protein
MRNAHLARLRYGVSRFWRRVGQVPGIYYVVAYVLMIFLFAGVYCILPGRPFYHSTAQYEEGMKPDSAALLANLTQEVRTDLESQFGTSTPVIRGWRLDLSQFQIASISVRNFPDATILSAAAPVSFETSLGQVTARFDGDLALGPRPSMVTNGTKLFFFQPPSAETTWAIDFLPREPELADIFHPLDSGLATSTVAIELSPQSWSQIVAFGDGYRGFPSRLPGQFWRMLYLSAGVSTSSALGDILPLTSLARGVMTLQALLSLLLVGFFLNSVATVISDREKSE